MHLSTLLDMAADAFGDRVAFGSRTSGLTFAELRDRSHRAASWLAARRVERVGMVAVNSDLLPVVLFGSGLAGLPFAPMNYRLADDQLRAIVGRTAPSVVVVDDGVADRIGTIEGVELIERATLLDLLGAEDSDAAPSTEGDPEAIAVLLFTSGTTGEPKAAVLRHRHLTSYVVSTVEFMGADDAEAALVSVPPYHIAGNSAIVTATFAGRRIVYLPAFSPEAWVAAARDEAITHAMVVPTMLNRILDVLERDDESLPSLRHLSYGGGRMPAPVIERAMERLPHVDFVNAYGLTETSSTISVLGPDDHRAALGNEDPVVRRRLGSVGRPLPSIEVQIRSRSGDPVPAGEPGEIWVRGEQVAGEYLGHDGGLVDGWFPTRDGGWLDADGFLYLEGRLDDVIVRGAENLSPGEIEDVLVAHPAVADAAVIGVPDTEWGEKVVAGIVVSDGASVTEEELRAWVRSQLRSSKAPEHVAFLDELPYTETGKLLRRVLRSDLAARYGV
jgi:fatty-acyl-CoA synthase